MKPEPVSDKRRDEIYDERNNEHLEATARPVSYYDFHVGFAAALEELGVAEVKEVEPCGRLEECQRQQRRVGQLRCAWVAFCPDKGPVLVRPKNPVKSP